MGKPWSVRWAFGTGDVAVAFLFARQLVAGPSPQVDGSNNKVLWEVQDHPSGGSVTVEGHPAGLSQPTVTFAGGPSIVDVPTAGCWTFALSMECERSAQQHDQSPGPPHGDSPS